MMRIIGAVCIIAAAVMLGIAHSGISKEKIKNLENTADFFARLREKISYERCDLATAMSECAVGDSGSFAAEITGVCDTVKINGKGFYDAWIATVRRGNSLGNEDIRTIDEFMKAADNGSAEAVMSAADSTIEKINQKLTELREYSEKNKKVFFSLWLYSGIFLVIILM